MINRPFKCRWCGCRDIEGENRFSHTLWITFACGTMAETLIGETRWLRDGQCAGKIGQAYKRIERAIEALKNAERYTAIGEESVVDWQRDPRGPVADAGAIERAISILEGESDGN